MGRGSFEKNVMLTPSDCDSGGVLTPAATLLFMQDVAGAGVDSVGLSHSALYDRGLVFMVACHAVRFARPVTVGESLRIHTDPAISRGAHMVRQTLFSDSDGNVVIEGQSDWILTDAKTGMPHRSTELSGELDGLPEWKPFCDPSRLKIPAADTPCREYTVTERDTDENLHMNNTVYARLMMLCLDEGESVSEFAIRYRSQVFPGDTLTLCRDGEYISGLRNGEVCFSGYFKEF